MENKNNFKRLLEIIPGTLSWGIIATFVILAFLQPVLCAVLIIIFDFYWIIRTAYLTTLLLLSYRTLRRQRNLDWVKKCEHLLPKKDWSKIYHLVIFPVYKETPDILRTSLETIRQARYPKDKMVVVIAFEERNPQAKEFAHILQKEYERDFFVYLSTFHPAGIPGETATKGANATWAAKKAKELIAAKNIPVEDVLISCFDADTCADKEYFGNLTYHFLTTPLPHQASYQPIAVYNNNIWHAPSFARIVEISSSFCQFIESMRLEKFVTFSSHSMSFKTLIDIDYWPVNMISDDSVVYWKGFLHFNGNYRVIPLYITVSMDVAYSTNLFKSISIQYKQKRRWAWGCENFPFVVSRLLPNQQIPLSLKIRKTYHLLESHVTWAVWAVILVLMPSLPILLGGAFFSQLSAIGYNLPRISGLLINFGIGTSLVWIILSRVTLPARPADVPWSKNIVMVFEWLLAPFIVLGIGSAPALDAQTRLMLGKYMVFEVTHKHRKNTSLPKR